MTTKRLRRGNWSFQELERLRQLLPRRGVHDTARLLHRSAESVSRKAMEILKMPARRGAWTSSDDERLRESWGVVEPRLLGPMLGRAPAEVVRRAAELRKQHQRGEWTRTELQMLKDIYGTRHGEDLEVALQRDAAEIAAMATRLCLAKDKRFAAKCHGTGTPSDVVAGAIPSTRQSMPRWQPADVELLRQIYADADNLSVARRMGRTVTSVANKANQLGLKKSPGLLADIGRTNVRIRYGHGTGASASGEQAEAGAD